MSGRRILIVGTALADVFAAKAARHEVYVIAREGSAKKLGGMYRAVQTLPDAAEEETWAKAVAEGCERWAIDRVAAFGERYQLATALGAETAGLQYHSPSTVMNVYDKYRMRRCLQRHGLSSLRTFLSDGKSYVSELTSRRPGEWIVKPRWGSGSVGVSRVVAGDEITYESLTTHQVSGPGFAGPPLVIEEYYPGRLFSVEAFHDGSVNHVVALCEGFFDPVTFGDTGRVLPADVSDAESESIREVLLKSLDALGVHWGPTHTELILGASGPEFIETHVRLGGDSIPRLVKLATGLDLHQLLFDAIVEDDVSCLEAPSGGPVRAAANWFGVAGRPGVVRSMRPKPGWLDQVDYIPLRQPGDHLPSGGSPNDLRLFEAVATGESSRVAVARARHASRLVRVDIEDCDEARP